MNKTSYQKFYQKITEYLYPHPNAIKALILTDKILAWSFSLAYPIFLAIVLFSRPFDLLFTANVVGLPALCFLCVTLLRRLIHRPRPYEKTGAGIDPLISKRGENNSMPSRHVASAFVIGTVILMQSTVFGAIALVCASALGFLRFLEGVHYPTDLIVGALLGAAFGSVGFLF